MSTSVKPASRKKPTEAELRLEKVAMKLRAEANALEGDANYFRGRKNRPTSATMVVATLNERARHLNILADFAETGE